MEGPIYVLQWEYRKVKDSTDSYRSIKFRDWLIIKAEKVVIIKNDAHISDLGDLEYDANY